MAKSVFTKNKLLIFFIVFIVVTVISLCVALGCYFYFGHQFDATNLSEYENFDDKLTLGNSFTVDDIMEAQGYNYSWVKASDVEVEIYAINSSEEYFICGNILNYDKSKKSFDVIGVSQGQIVFKNMADSSINLTVPFQTCFAQPDTENIIKSNYPHMFDDGIIDSEEVKEVRELTFETVQTYDISDFANFPNLNRVILSTPKDMISLTGLNKINETVVFYVTDGLYNNYITSADWVAYSDRIFPIVNLNEGNCTLVFNFNGGVMDGVSDGTEQYFANVNEGESIDIEKYSINRTGYTFAGWYVGDNGGETLTDLVSNNYVFKKNTKLYAKWIVNEYDIVYIDSYDTPPESQHVLYDETVSLTTAILNRTGYTFLGWATVEGSTVVEYEPGQSVSNLIAENEGLFNLYAVWGANSYSIIYDANGGVDAPSMQTNINFDERVSISAQLPRKTGYTFLGWATNQSAKEADYVAGQEVMNLISDSAGKVILYAIWAPNSYSIKYDANGGTNAPTEQLGLKYGEPVQLSSSEPQWFGRVFQGWSLNKDALYASYAAGGLVDNLVADAGGTAVLYAIWLPDVFRIKYDANGGEKAPSISTYITYDNEFKSITSSEPTRTGYTFSGWSTSASGEVLYHPGQELSKEEVNKLYNTTGYRILYAVWSVNYYKVTVSTQDAKVSGVTNGASYAYGTKITLKISYTYSDYRSVKINGKSIGAPTSYTYTIPAGTVKIEAGSSDNCIASGSLITLADGSTTAVENLNVGDEVMVFNHETGMFDKSFIAYIENDGFNDYETLTLYFEEGISVKVMSEHGFFDNTLNKYVMISLANAAEYVGHSFYYTCFDGDEYISKSVELIDYSIEVEYLDTYSFVTALHYNHIVNGLLGMPAGIDGLYNIFELDANMKYAEEAMQHDIELYGLSSYEEWSEYVTYDEFIIFNGQYLSVAIGKGMITKEGVVKIILRYLHPEKKVVE